MRKWGTENKKLEAEVNSLVHAFLHLFTFHYKVCPYESIVTYMAEDNYGFLKPKAYI